MIKILGSGQYGKVQLVVNVADLQPYAIKTVSKAKLRTSIRRIRSSLSRHSYGNLSMAASQAVASVDSAADPNPPFESQKASPPPTESDSSPSPSSAASSTPSSPFVGMPNLPGAELFTTAPPNSRFGGGSKKKLQPVAELPAAPSTIAASVLSSDAAPGRSEPPAGVPVQSKAVSPFAACGKPKVISPFAAAAKASLQVLTQAATAETPATPGIVSPRLRSSLGLSALDADSTSLDTSFGGPASARGGLDMGPPVTPRQSLAERPMPRPSVERVAQLRGYGAPAELESDYGSRASLPERPVPRPSLEHIAHLRGFARANSTPNTGLADSFSMTRSASIRATPRAADVVQEIAVMKKLNHPNIVRLYEVRPAG